MSPLWHERVFIGFAPERLSALCLGGWPRPRLIDRQAVPLHEQDAAQWEKGIAALEILLAEPAWSGRDVALLLSSHYVRHVIFPADSGLAEADRQALAAVVFRDTFGDLANDWELRVSPSGGRQTLACGVPRTLLAALRAACAGRARLLSVRPALMPVFNRVRREIGDSVGCVALIEPGRITLAFVEHGLWKYVDSRAGDGNMLPLLLLEEGALSERQPGGILWLCDLSATARLPADAFWSHRLVAPPRLAGGDGVASLALWGLVP